MELKGPLKVYHNPSFNDAYYSGGSLPTVKDSVLVATVDTDDVDKAYELTNNIHSLWVENGGLIAHDHENNGRGHRSTSMGDLIVGADGQVLICATFGWHTPEQYLAHMVIHEQKMVEWREDHARRLVEEEAARVADWEGVKARQAAGESPQSLLWPTEMGRRYFESGT